MFVSCSNVLLPVSFVQSLVCCDLTLKYVERQPLSVNVYGVKSAYWTVCTLNLPSCDTGKKHVLMLKNSTILLIFNLVFQVNFQAVFYCDCA